MTIRRAIRPLGSGEICPYEENQVLFESSTPGNYNLEVKSTSDCEVEICGGGGGGMRIVGVKSKHYTGGSASAFKGIIKLKKGIYPLTIGDRGTCGSDYGGTNGAASSIGDIIVCGGGYAYANGGAGGILTLNVSPISAEISSNGQAQSQVSLLGNGFGQGGYSWNTQPTCGYMKIVYKG